MPRNVTLDRPLVLSSLGHQRLVGLGLGGSEIAKAVSLAGGRRVSRQLAGSWLHGERPHEAAAAALRGLYGIQLRDWERPAADVDVRPEPETAPAPEVAPTITLVELGAALRGVQADLAAAQSAEATRDVATLRTQERQYLLAIHRACEDARTMRERTMECPPLQAFVRLASDVLRPMLGDDWPRVVERLSRVWAAIGEDGQVPDGFEP